VKTSGAPVESIDGALVFTATIGNFVWSDIDRDGIQDAGEGGISGVSVELWNSARTIRYGASTTNAEGKYGVVARGTDTYRVRFIKPAGPTSFSPKDAGGDDARDSDAIASGVDAGWTDEIFVASNLISTTLVDAGIRPPLLLLPLP
jgi:hypothetical protein